MSSSSTPRGSKKIDQDLKELIRSKAEAQVTLGRAQTVKVYRALTEGEPCDCDRSLNCELCYGVGFVGGYAVVEEVIIEKLPHPCFGFGPDRYRFMICHKEPLEAQDLFYYHDLQVDSVRLYRVLSTVARVPNLGTTEVECSQVPTWMAIHQFPLEK